MKKIKISGGLFIKSPRSSLVFRIFGRVERLPGNLITACKIGWQKVKEKNTRMLKRTKQSINSFITMLNDSTSKQVVTLDINGKSIKLLEARGRTVKRWASTPFELGVEKEDRSARLNALGIAVKQLMAKSGIKANKVILSVSGLFSINRLLESAAASVGNMNQESIRALVNEEMILTGEQLYLAWKVIRPLGGVGQIYVMGILRDELDGQIRSLKKVGINPYIIESKAVTLSRLANKKNTLILNIEPSSYDIIVVSNSIPTISHTTAWQAEVIGAEDKAEQLLLALGLAVDFNNSHNPEAMIETPVSLVIMGQLSADADLMTKLRAMSDYDIEPIAPPIKYPADFLLPEYTTNVGLALRDSEQISNLFGKLNSGLPKRRSDISQTQDTYESLAINLLPKAYHPWRPSPMQVFSVAALVIAAGLIIPLLQVVTESMNQTSVMELKYKNLNNLLERRKLEIKSREPIAAAVSEYQTIINMAGYFNDDLQLIRDIAENLSVQLLSVTHSGKIINISCEADNSTLRQFATALQDSGKFVKVTLPDAFWVYPLPASVDIELESKMGK